MSFEFTLDHAVEIATVLDTTFKQTAQVFRYELHDVASGRKLALEIHPGLVINGKKTNLVSVYSAQTFLQLHNCTGFIASELLEQVTFFGKTGDLTTGLIVERSAGTSIYANVNEELLRGDFTRLPTELMMCSVALSLSDSIDEDFRFDEEN
jgi:hypothetical protein